MILVKLVLVLEFPNLASLRTDIPNAMKKGEGAGFFKWHNPSSGDHTGSSHLCQMRVTHHLPQERGGGLCQWSIILWIICPPQQSVYFHVLVYKVKMRQDSTFTKIFTILSTEKCSDCNYSYEFINVWLGHKMSLQMGTCKGSPGKFDLHPQSLCCGRISLKSN